MTLWGGAGDDVYELDMAATIRLGKLLKAAEIMWTTSVTFPKLVALSLYVRPASIISDSCIRCVYLLRYGLDSNIGMPPFCIQLGQKHSRRALHQPQQKFRIHEHTKPRLGFSDTHSTSPTFVEAADTPQQQDWSHSNVRDWKQVSEPILPSVRDSVRGLTEQVVLSLLCFVSSST